MQEDSKAFLLKLPNVTHMSSNHLHRQVSHPVTFCFNKVTTKYYQTPNIQVPWLSRASRVLPEKPTSNWGHSETVSFIQPWHFSTGEEGIALNQPQFRISTSCSAHGPLYVPVWVTLHLQSGCAGASSPLLPALPPWSLCPSSSFPPQLAGRKQAEPTASAGSAASSSSPWHHHHTTSLTPTLSPASSAGQAFSPFSITPVTSGYPVLSAQRNRIKLQT